MKIIKKIYKNTNDTKTSPEIKMKSENIQIKLNSKD